MDQIFQLQRQIQDLRQEVNTINQVAGQLQRSEANNTSQLQRLLQNESSATQQLQAIQQLCNRLNQDVNVISNVANQVTAHMSRPMTSGQFGYGSWAQPITGQFGSWSQPFTGQFGGFNPSLSTGLHGQSQYGTFGAQFGTNRNDEFQRNQYISQMASNRYGLGFNSPDYATNQYISGLASQGQSAFGLGAGNAYGTGLSQTGFAGTATGNFAVQPTHPVQTSQFGTTGFSGSQYVPSYGAGQWGAGNQYGSGLFGNQAAGGQMGRYNNF